MNEKEKLSSAISRGIALFFAGFSLLNLLGEWVRPGFDANLWWIDLRVLPSWLAVILLFVSSLLLLSLVFVENRSLQRAALISCLILSAFALLNIFSYYYLFFSEEISSELPLPLSLPILFCLLSVSLWIWKKTTQPKKRWGLSVCVILLLGFLAPFSQMLFLGLTDYKRPVDAILVLGARAYADGTASDALADRIIAACSLYQEGLAPRMILSGGPGDGEFTEPDVMKRFALDCGVPEENITLDPQGINTQATVENTMALLEKFNIKRVLVVSHFYHLPRIKMAFQREGLEVYTSPAPQRRVLLGLPFFLVREVAALWFYYLMLK